MAGSRKELLTYTGAVNNQFESLLHNEKGKSIKSSKTSEALIRANIKSPYWRNHISSFLGPTSEVMELVEKIRNREIPVIDEFLNLKGVNLRDADLSGLNLERSNLTGAQLEGANLKKTNLSNSALFKTHLERANLKEAILMITNLTEAQLEGADLRGAQLQGANLRYTNLEGADLSDANLQGANLRGANLRGAHLEGAHLEDTELDLSRYGLPQDFLDKNHLKMLTHERFRSFFICFKDKLLYFLNRSSKTFDDIKNDVSNMINNLPDFKYYSDSEIQELCIELCIKEFSKLFPQQHLEYSVRPSIKQPSTTKSWSIFKGGKRQYLASSFRAGITRRKHRKNKKTKSKNIK
jgi:uncharacterized protein YjbI with pentapeptide repeats